MASRLNEQAPAPIIFMQRLSDGSMNSLVYTNPMDLRMLPSAEDMKQDWISPNVKVVGSAVIHRKADGNWEWLWICDEQTQQRHPIEYLEENGTPSSAQEWSGALLDKDVTISGPFKFVVLLCDNTLWVTYVVDEVDARTIWPADNVWLMATVSDAAVDYAGFLVPRAIMILDASTEKPVYTWFTDRDAKHLHEGFEQSLLWQSFTPEQQAFCKNPHLINEDEIQNQRLRTEGYPYEGPDGVKRQRTG